MALAEPDVQIEHNNTYVHCEIQFARITRQPFVEVYDDICYLHPGGIATCSKFERRWIPNTQLGADVFKGKV